jgi:Domain of unknown function (DUF4294)
VNCSLKNIIISIFVSCLYCIGVHAQQTTTDSVKALQFISKKGDTLIRSNLGEVTVKTKLTKEQKRRLEQWTRLRNAVYVTYPYARAAAKIMNEINAQLVNVKEKSKRRAIIRSREKDLRKEFTSKLTSLSIYQGKVLMKLIDRETGNNCYEIIDEYKGSFNAVLYQSVAFFFGTSLKQNYDAKGADKDMESIVKEVERMYGIRG